MSCCDITSRNHNFPGMKAMNTTDPTPVPAGPEVSLDSENITRDETAGKGINPEDVGVANEAALTPALAVPLPAGALTTGEWITSEDGKYLLPSGNAWAHRGDPKATVANVSLADGSTVAAEFDARPDAIAYELGSKDGLMVVTRKKTKRDELLAVREGKLARVCSLPSPGFEADREISPDFQLAVVCNRNGNGLVFDLTRKSLIGNGPRRLGRIHEMDSAKRIKFSPDCLSFAGLNQAGKAVIHTVGQGQKLESTVVEGSEVFSGNLVFYLKTNDTHSRLVVMDHGFVGVSALEKTPEGCRVVSPMKIVPSPFMSGDPVVRFSPGLDFLSTYRGGTLAIYDLRPCYEGREPRRVGIIEEVSGLGKLSFPDDRTFVIQKESKQGERLEIYRL